MLSLEEARKLNPEGILKEIKERNDLMHQMLGWLYPSILQQEIEQLYNQYLSKAYTRSEKP